MSERAPHARAALDAEIAEKFAAVSNQRLIQRIESAAAFGYDDEAYELNRRLRLGGLAWRFALSETGREVVQVYRPEDER